MEKAPNKITTKIIERILELNVKLKAQGLDSLSFELNEEGYLVLVEKFSDYTSLLAVLEIFTEAEALDWLSYQERFIPLYYPLMRYFGTESYAKLVIQNQPFPVNSVANFSLEVLPFQYRLRLMKDDRIVVQVTLKSAKDLSKLVGWDRSVRIKTVELIGEGTGSSVFESEVMFTLQTTAIQLTDSLKGAEQRLLSLVEGYE